jgi:hypothetical protein
MCFVVFFTFCITVKVKNHQKVQIFFFDWLNFQKNGKK